ncbi:MAG TPA: hypothetical protein PKE31_10640 [Pseudomonadota bacterium]|nr:hypothetical protein [Pseudomonadota bacterium]
MKLVGLLVAVVVAFSGCKNDARVLPVVVDGRVSAQAKGAEEPRSIADLASAEVAAVAPGEEAVLELSGTVEMASDGRPRFPVSVIVSVGDCSEPGSQLLRRVPLGDGGGFFVVVMASPGQALSVCAASEPAPGLPTPLWAKSEPILVKTAKDQSKGDLALTLRSAEPKRFATPASSKTLSPKHP